MVWSFTVLSNLQACRGDRLAENVEVTDGEMEDEIDSGSVSVEVHDMPIYRDFLLAYSTPPGKYNSV